MTSVESDREISPKGRSQKEVDHEGAVLTDRHLYYKPYFAICTLKFSTYRNFGHQHDKKSAGRAR